MEETKKQLLQKTYLENEESNEHSKNALLLVEEFGTKEELKQIKKINETHEKKGFLTFEEMKKRYNISNKYHSKLFN